ncbi:MAG: HAD-IIA family hydrolase [Rubrimonas sp.]
MTAAHTLPTMDAAAACARYEAVRDRLPRAVFPDGWRAAADLQAVADAFDAFVLDGFGVLNVGEAPVPGAAARMAALRAMGKTLIVLSNSATHPTAAMATKYARFGIDFAPRDIVSSRDALAAALAAWPDPLRWGFAATPESRIEALAPGAILLGEDPAGYDAAEGFALLSANAWGPARQALLVEALKRRPRPVLVGNPDLVAPREGGLSLEPGFYAHALQDETGVAPVFHGKPFADAFALAAARLPAGIDPRRVAMVGDTLHTDILGGAAQGWRTILVRAHGLLKDLDHARLIAETGITPDFVVETT